MSKLHIHITLRKGFDVYVAIKPMSKLHIHITLRKGSDVYVEKYMAPCMFNIM